MAYQMLEATQMNKMENKMEVDMKKLNLEQSGNQPDQNFCLDDNGIPKKRKKKSKSPYSPKKTKARNFLCNISYRHISDKDFRNANFIIYILSYIVMNLKLFFLTTTYSGPEQQDMVKMLWEKCLLNKFYEHVKKPENFEILNSGKINFK